jgi:hypothetical protein
MGISVFDLLHVTTLVLDPSFYFVAGPAFLFEFFRLPLKIGFWALIVVMYANSSAAIASAPGRKIVRLPFSQSGFK